LPIQEGNQPANRPRKPQIAIPPAHKPLAFQIQNPLRNTFRQNVSGGPTDNGLAGKDKFSFIRSSNFQSRQLQIAGAGKS